MTDAAPIVAARALRQDQPFAAGSCMCRGQAGQGVQAVIVTLEAADGTVGRGKTAPLGAFFAETFPEEIAHGVACLLPQVTGLGSDPPARRADALDAAILGQPGVKSAIGLAARDLAARRAGMPLAENRAVARACPHPVMLDESITGLDALLTARAQAPISGATLKIARLGGVGPTRMLRDLAVRLGLKPTIEDAGGSTIDTAATAHLMASLWPRHAADTADFMNWVTLENARGMPPCSDGMLHLPEGPGLGITVDDGRLGAPSASAAAG